MHSIWFLALGVTCIAVVVFLVILVLFEPGLRYEVAGPGLAVESDQFLCLLGALADAQVHRHSRVEVLSGAEVFYEAELEAIRSARHSVHLEAFLFIPGPITDRFVEALTERAKSGVKVRVVVDWFGCLHTPDRYFERLRAAGGRVYWYQPLRLSTFKRFNNRTHRELIVIDGAVGFIGGAGIADHWLGGHKGEVPWHDMMCRVEGPLVTGLQTTFAENWLESADEILTGPDEFPLCLSGRDAPAPAGEAPGTIRGLVVVSTPSAARSTRARIVFQTLLASAARSVDINSPYFLPDRSARRELVRAVKRGVRVRVVTPGASNNHPLARRASRRRYGELLKAGVEIYEYQPGMIHKKAMVVDGVWSVVGSTNFDMRSFGLNDEVNLAALDSGLAQRLERDFDAELAQSTRITLAAWKHRPLREKILAAAGAILERQE